MNTIDFKKYNYYYNNLFNKWEEQEKECFRNKHTNKFWYNGEWIANPPYQTKTEEEDIEHKVIPSYL